MVLESKAYKIIKNYLIKHGLINISLLCIDISRPSLQFVIVLGSVSMHIYNLSNILQYFPSQFYLGRMFVVITY